jgi:GTP cyclohydrolase II
LLRFGIGAQILKDLGVARMRLLAAPRRIPSMTGFGLEVTRYVERPEVEQTLRSAKAGASHARKG